MVMSESDVDVVSQLKSVDKMVELKNFYTESKILYTIVEHLFNLSICSTGSCSFAVVVLHVQLF